MTVFLDPRQETRDGHHGHLIEAAMREVMGDTAHRPPTEHRIAQRSLVIGRGELVVPFNTGWRLQSIRGLDVGLEREASVVGYGPMPGVVILDGTAYCHFDARRGNVEGRRSRNGGRTDVPDNVVLSYKSIEAPTSPNHTHIRFDGAIGGLWKYAGYRGGNEQYSGAQEDHYKGDIQVYGNYEVASDTGAPADLCRVGVWGGNPAWSNNRRHYYGMLHVAWCETAVRNQQTAVTVDNLVADGCRDVLAYGGGRLVIRGGEAEDCARLINDVAWLGHDFPLVMRDFHAGLTRWKRGMSGIDNSKYDTAFSIWGTRANCHLQNVSIGGLPVSYRNTYAEMSAKPLKHLDGGEPPRFWTAQPISNVFLEQGSAVHGYRREEVFAYERQGCGQGRTEVGWKDVRSDGFVVRTVLAADNLPMPK